MYQNLTSTTRATQVSLSPLACQHCANNAWHLCTCPPHRLQQRRPPGARPHPTRLRVARRCLNAMFPRMAYEIQIHVLFKNFITVDFSLAFCQDAKINSSFIPQSPGHLAVGLANWWISDISDYQTSHPDDPPASINKVVARSIRPTIEMVICSNLCSNAS